MSFPRNGDPPPHLEPYGTFTVVGGGNTIPPGGVALRIAHAHPLLTTVVRV